MFVALVGTFQLMKLLFTQWVLVEFKFRDMVGDISLDEIARHPMGPRYRPDALRNDLGIEVGYLPLFA